MKPARLGFVFPGQGSQFVGMGAGLEEISDTVDDLYASANETLGFSITDIMFSGPDERLKQTVYTQPALYLSSAAAYVLLEKQGIRPAVVAGHSLGEYSALYAAGVLDFGHALWLVQHRGQLMQSAGETAPGSMAAILGLEDEQLTEICAATDGSVVIANYNSPGQIVISGRTDAVNTVIDQCKAAGAKRALPLPVSGAFHSPLMSGPSAELNHLIDKTNFHQPRVPVISNVDGQSHSDPAVIKENLKLQMMSSVRWTQTIATMVELGVDGIVEVGAGKVLSGLIKRIAKDIPVWNVGTAAELDAAAEALA